MDKDCIEDFKRVYNADVANGTFNHRLHSFVLDLLLRWETRKLRDILENIKMNQK